MIIVDESLASGLSMVRRRKTACSVMAERATPLYRFGILLDAPGISQDASQR